MATPPIATFRCNKFPVDSQLKKEFGTGADDFPPYGESLGNRGPLNLDLMY